MKRALLALLVLGAVSSARADEGRTLTPYFNFGIDEGVYIAGDRSQYFSGGNVNTSVGMLANLAERHSLFGLYNLNYSGAGFAPQDTKEFLSRTLDHNASFEYRWQLAGPFRLRPGVAFGKSFYRSAANEPWGQGLYDTNSSGAQMAVDYTFKNGALTAQYLTRSVKFPNYTDLLREFQSAGAQAELSGGLQDQTLKEFSLNAYWKKLFATAKFGKQDYDNQTVVESNGVYGSTLQEDKSTTLSAGFVGKLWIFEVQPQASYVKHTSNQNYLNFKFFGDPSPDFVANAYNYKDTTLSVPFYLNLTQRTALNANFAVTQRNYDDRPPRDANNAYLLGDKQKNTMTTLGVGIRKRLNEVAYLRLTYSLVVASSNNKFERYLPYNYTGNQVNLGFSLAY